MLDEQCPYTFNTGAHLPTATVHHGDCLEVMRSLPDNSVDAIVTDPPYGLGFMGKAWDQLPPGLEWAVECLRVLKPGGHLLAFGGTRTWHRLACAVEDAGFEVRDSIAWLYGSGFPKSLDVSKAIDKQRDDRAEVRAVCSFLRGAHRANPRPRREIDAHFGTANIGGHWFTPDSHLAQCPTWEQWLWLREWLGFGDEMDAEVWRLNGRKGSPGDAWDQRKVVGSKQAGMGSGKTFGMLQSEGRNSDASHEINVTAPATEAAQQWQGWGTALKPAFEPVVVARKPLTGTVAANVLTHGTGALNIDGCRTGTEERVNAPASGLGNGVNMSGGVAQVGRDATVATGRWPANVVLDESQAEALDAARFFYVAKAPKSERPTYERPDEAGTMFSGSIRKRCIHCGKQEVNVGASACSCPAPDFQPDPSMVGKVAHPTVKPLALMRWLVRLVTPPGGTVLEPFAGSGTTVEACLLEGFDCVAIEREADYLPLVEARIARAEARSVGPTQGALDFEETA